VDEYHRTCEECHTTFSFKAVDIDEIEGDEWERTGKIKFKRVKVGRFLFLPTYENRPIYEKEKVHWHHTFVVCPICGKHNILKITQTNLKTKKCGSYESK
jgi:Fe2+ or Zn2+ uptake regulation protein